MRAGDLREETCRVNREIVRAGLVTLTWGNASGIDRENSLVAIKPSGVDYDALRPEDIVLVDLESGEVVEGDLRPSSDTPTHLALYRAFSSIGGIVHTHSTHATAWCQARRPLPAMGTTHADHFFGTVPVARTLRPSEVSSAYEANTGLAIVDTFRELGIDPGQVPAVLLPGHAPFVWGGSLKAALENAIVLEECARMALLTLQLYRDGPELEPEVLEKHFLRKHGPGAYYGQGK